MLVNGLFCATVIHLLYSSVHSKVIKIRGLGSSQYLPQAQALNWPAWTYDITESTLSEVESDGDNSNGWINPTTFDEIYFPRDLPLPRCQPCLSILIANNSPRYLMPGVVMTLETPDKLWRNRGMKSLPRSNAWIDLFTAFPAGIKYLNKMNMAVFGKMTQEIRFLEDIDGSAAWEDILTISGKQLYDTYESFTAAFQEEQTRSDDLFKSLREGYHYVDIPFPDIERMVIPRFRMKMFLSDFDTPRGLIEAEGDRIVGTPEQPVEELSTMSLLDSEACAELDVVCKVVAAGGQSKFLPAVYRDLFDGGNIMNDPRKR